MIYSSADNFIKSDNKRVMLFGMSGLGKTYLSNLLRNGNAFHYSVDYRLGTRYMGEHIVDNLKAEAMSNKYLAGLLRSDSIRIRSNLRFFDLSPLSVFMSKPGDTDKGGIPFDEYTRRQLLHYKAEINAMNDIPYFIERAKKIYNYDDFVCDTSGSLVEICDGNNLDDEILLLASKNLLPVWIRGTDANTEELITRFSAAPKPMYYSPDFLQTCWAQYLVEKSVTEDKVDPDDFIRWGYRRLLDERLPRYRAIAENWGVTIEADDVEEVKKTDAFYALIGRAIDAKNKGNK